MANSDLMSNLFGDGGLKTKPVVNAIEESIFFRPSAKKGQNNRFEAIVRFVPNLEDIYKCSISKFTVFLKDPRTGQGKTIDSPSTVGDPDPLSQMFFTLRNAKKTMPIVGEKKLDDNFKRHQNFYSLIQVLECKSDPSIVGKFLIWRYGDKINGKLQTEQTPVMQGMEPGQPFDLFKGRLFKVVVTKNGEFDDYDQSMFFDIQYPANCLRMFIPQTDSMGQITNNQVIASRELASTPEGQNQILTYLQNNAPKLSQCDYKPWDDETRKYVDEMILIHSRILNGEPITPMQQNANAYQTIQNQNMNPMVAQTTPVTTPTPSMGSILGGGMSVPVANPVNVPTSTPNFGIPTPTPPTPVVETQTPQIQGLSFGDNAMGGTPTAPMGGSVQGVDMSAIEGLMGGQTPTPQAATPTAPNNLRAILGDIM